MSVVVDGKQDKEFLRQAFFVIGLSAVHLFFKQKQINSNPNTVVIICLLLKLNLPHSHIFLADMVYILSVAYRSIRLKNALKVLANMLAKGLQE